MTTSGSINFSVSRDDLITEALMHIGALPEGGTPTAAQISDASRTLNIMIKRWMAKPGIDLWAIDTVTLALVTNQATYTTGVATFTRTDTGAAVSATYIKAILEAVVRDSNSIDLPVTIVSREEYFNLGNKASSGRVNQIYFQPNLASSTISVYPVSSNSTDTLRLIVKRTLEDFDATGDTPDFPQEWYEALYLGLAARLARPYRLPISERASLKQEADEALEEVMDWNVEQGTSIKITPSPRR
jgi:hypothetical protein